MTAALRGFEFVKEGMLKDVTETSVLKLPARGTSRSAGYDFVTPNRLVIPAHGSAFFWTNIKAWMQPDEVLYIHIRSSIGNKGLRIKNTLGVIDADYYGNPSNDGNIGIGLVNTTDEEIILEAGERVAQGVFHQFLTCGDEPESERTGGYGSTGTK